MAETTKLRLGFFMPKVKRDKFLWKRFEDFAEEHSDLIEYTLVDIAKDIESQGSFDILLIRIIDILAKEGNNDPHTDLCLANIRKYCQENPQVVIIDPIQKQRQLLKREITSELLIQTETALEKSLAGSGNRFRLPKHRTITEQAEHYDVSGMKFPLISKALEACGSAAAHEMCVLFSQEHVDSLKAPFLLQEFFNHDGVIFKIYALGEKFFITKKNSIPNLDVNHAEIVRFDSQLPLVPQLAAARDPSDTKTDQELIDNAKNPDSDLVAQINAKLHTSLDLSLFGYDLIIESSTGDASVIDVNYFPSYKGMENFAELLFQYLATKKKNKSTTDKA
eukprot:TRINITY_DN8415_c0_g1_i1.p1 TRINITY_DN8415_c0_g1~~TRINITY_DN8415_c0_g1_i1.p1  ORF type:complete len:336 (-),score=58.25 TRINITY_DN8415_c0_g1_i1:11-1018(-)